MQTRKRQHRGAAPRTETDVEKPSVRTDEPRQAPERRCAVTGISQPVDRLIRFALGPAGVVPDLAGRLPGRGAWVTATRSHVEEAVKKKVFARAFKRPVDYPADLPDLVEKLLRRRVLNLTSMANKAGAAVAGFSKVETTLREGCTSVLLHASDGASDGCRKLDGLARAAEEYFGTKPEIISLFHSDELSLAFGRENVVHAALKQGGISASFLNELERLRRYAAGTGDLDIREPGAATRNSRCTEKE